MKKTLYANGKLLIMGEYTVLDGADAFALPTKFGQQLDVAANKQNVINWQSYDADNSAWLNLILPIDEIVSGYNTDKTAEAAMLIKVLHAAHNANPEILKVGYNVTTKLTFPKNWGLGTSSTLIALVAQWFGIDAYKLLAQTFGGSGYDIACAIHNKPLLYTLKQNKPYVEFINFKPAFADKLYFIYLNEKQNSREAIAAYRKRSFDKTLLITQINKLVKDIITAKDLCSFTSALEKHEALMAGILGIAPVQEKLFPDFKGVVKSLGAWGGDFVLAVSEEYPEDYFKQKGYSTIIPYNDMIL